ncbi:MAG: patatin-like phospholipase family protein [Candidatus Omnitrophota bacterium]
MAEIKYIVNKFSIVDSLPLFSKLSFFQKNFIVSKSEVIELKKGEVVYKEGSPPDYFYCIVSGRIEMYHAGAKAQNRPKQQIERLRRGDYFGSISSLTGQPHSVSTKTLNDSLVLKINTKDFNVILQKIPRLAVSLSRSLSRRFSQKRFKEIFVSSIISVYGPDGSFYSATLADSIRKESGKKVVVVASTGISKKKDVAPKLSALTEDHHYVIINISGEVNNLNLEIMKQSDACHILSLPDHKSLRKTSMLIKSLKNLFGDLAEDPISVILKEEDHYEKTAYGEKSRILSKEVFATLPQDLVKYKKTLRRIARGISGIMTGIALGSGAAMAIAHIGVIKVLEKEKIPIDIISASSMGAIIGSLWALGLNADELEKVANIFKSRFRTLLLADLTLPIKGLIKGHAVRRFLKTYLGEKTFQDLKLPLKVVACDIKTRKEVIIDKGKLVDAVMASISIPGIFEPVEFNDAWLIDGGIVNPVPVNVLSKMGIKRIIAVNTLPSPEDAAFIGRKRKSFTIYDVIVNSFQELEYALAVNACRQADIYLKPIPKNVSWFEFYKARIFINTGSEHARRMLPEIKKLVK